MQAFPTTKPYCFLNITAFTATSICPLFFGYTLPFVGLICWICFTEGTALGDDCFSLVSARSVPSSCNDVARRSPSPISSKLRVCRRWRQAERAIRAGEEGKGKAKSKLIGVARGVSMVCSEHILFLLTTWWCCRALRMCYCCIWFGGKYDTSIHEGSSPPKSKYIT